MPLSEHFFLKCDIVAYVLDDFKKALDHTKRQTDPDNLSAAYDSEVRRFAFAFASMIRFLKAFLSHKHEIYLDAPKKVLQECFDLQIISEQQLSVLLAAVLDFSIVMELYYREPSLEIRDMFSEYYATMQAVLARLRENNG